MTPAIAPHAPAHRERDTHERVHALQMAKAILRTIRMSGSAEVYLIRADQPKASLHTGIIRVNGWGRRMKPRSTVFLNREELGAGVFQKT